MVPIIKYNATFIWPRPHYIFMQQPCRHIIGNVVVSIVLLIIGVKIVLADIIDTEERLSYR